MMNTDRTAAVSLCSGWIMSYILAIFRSASATIGNCRSVCCVSLTSAIHLRCSAAVSVDRPRSEEHTSELQSLMRISYAVFCLKKKKNKNRALHVLHKTHKIQRD